VVACADTDRAASYEVGIVTRVRDGLADAWRTADGTVRPARFVPGLRYRWLVPQGDIDVASAMHAAARRDQPFASISEVKAAMRPWLHGRQHQMEAGS
jgi:hypothetical protein